MALSESFWIFVAGGGFGMILSSMKMCGESKCKTCSFGCIKVERDTEAEVAMSHDRMEHGFSPSMIETPRQNNMSIDRGI